MTLTPDQIGELAPDAQVLASGRKLGKPTHWQSFGRQGSVVWGECRGGTLYQVRADTMGIRFKCSCPSRKQPCKHVIGLLALDAEQSSGLPDAVPPAWVAEWLVRSEARADGKKQTTQPATDRVERRSMERRAHILEGMDALELWMCDLVRNGLASLEAQPASLWQHQAARLVDAEAPGLGSWIRRISGIVGSSPDWPERLLGELGRIELLIHAFRRWESIDPLLQHDVHALIGWHLTKEEVAALGESVIDHWVATGEIVEEDGGLRVQRTWLCGLRTERTALILQFAGGASRTFPPVTPFNHAQEMELHFWPSAWPQRALIAHRLGDAVYSTDRRPGYPSVEDMLTGVARALSANPWIDRTFAVLHDVVPLRRDDEWLIRDSAGAALPLQPQPHWRMLAQSGGYPIDIHGEWDGRVFHSLSIRTAETMS